MGDRGEEGRRQAKAGDRFRWRLFETPRGDRIDGPDKGAAERQTIAAPGGAGEQRAIGFAYEKRGDAGETERRANDMTRAEALARLHGREEDDQQRPEIGYETRLGRRRAPERGEIECVIAEESADPDDPYRPRLNERAQPPAQESIDQP